MPKDFYPVIHGDDTVIPKFYHEVMGCLVIRESSPLLKLPMNPALSDGTH